MLSSDISEEHHREAASSPPNRLFSTRVDHADQMRDSTVHYSSACGLVQRVEITVFLGDPCTVRLSGAEIWLALKFLHAQENFNSDSTTQNHVIKQDSANCPTNVFRLEPGTSVIGDNFTARSDPRGKT